MLSKFSVMLEYRYKSHNYHKLATFSGLNEKSIHNRVDRNDNGKRITVIGTITVIGLCTVIMQKENGQLCSNAKTPFVSLTIRNISYNVFF